MEMRLTQFIKKPGQLFQRRKKLQSSVMKSLHQRYVGPFGIKVKSVFSFFVTGINLDCHQLAWISDFIISLYRKSIFVFFAHDL